MGEELVGPVEEPTAPAFDHFGGRQIEACALQKVLAHLDVNAPHTGKPFSEAMLFGLGGGLGLGYFVYESGSFVSLFLGTRHMTQETPQAGFIQEICERLGVPVVLQAASNITTSERKLIQVLETGRPMIVWVDPRNLPYYGTPNAYHPVVIYGYEPVRSLFLISDRSAVPLSLSSFELNTARQGEGAPRYRAIMIEAPTVLSDLDIALNDSIRLFCQQMEEGFGPANFRKNFGLNALIKWASLLVDKRDKRGWPKFFPPGERLFAALVSLYEQIENRSQDGAALRPLYAEFLDEAALVLEKPTLEEAAELFRESADLWRILAESLLPGSSPFLSETRRMLNLKKVTFETRGMDGLEESHNLDLRLAQQRSQVKTAFPLSKDEVKSLFEHLRQQVLAIHAVEAKAVAAIGDAFQSNL